MVVMKTILGNNLIFQMALFLGMTWNRKKQSAARVCKSPLGLSTPGTFKLTASSERATGDAKAEMGRLYLKGNGWCAKTSAIGEYLEVQFPSLTTVVAVAVQSGDSDPSQYVKSLTVKYK